MKPERRGVNRNHLILAQFSFEDILQKIRTKRYNGKIDLQVPIWGGDLNFSVNTYSKKFRCFLKNPRCRNCQVLGSYWKLEHNNRDGYLPEQVFLSLWGLGKNGEEVLLTMDHIIPLSRGGPRGLGNLQTLCYICNQKKGSSDFSNKSNSKNNLTQTCRPWERETNIYVASDYLW